MLQHYAMRPCCRLVPLGWQSVCLAMLIPREPILAAFNSQHEKHSASLLGQHPMTGTQPAFVVHADR